MAITRQLLFVVSPKDGVVNTFSFSGIDDANNESKAFTCGHVPGARGSGATLMQDLMFLGTTSAVGQTYRTFDDSLGADGSDSIVSEFITARIDPDNRDERARDSTTKRYEWADFNGPNLSEFGGSLYWASDVDPVREPMLSWNQFSLSSGDTRGYFESGLANHVHLRGVHTGSDQGKIHLSGFAIHYTTVARGEGRDS